MSDTAIITLNSNNIEQQHICCAISDKKCAEGVRLKKEWLQERFQEGLRFKKLDVRQKVFIEYVPAEYAWCPVEAPGYLFINCLWVAGSFKGKGHGTQLLAECLEEAQGANGIVAVTGRTKKPYLSDKSYFLHNGFQVCDQAPPYFELVVLKFNETAPTPKFKATVQSQKVGFSEGLQLLYTAQCPYTSYYVGELETSAQEHGIPLQVRRIMSTEEAQNAPTPYTSYSLFYKGNFITHEIMTRNKFEKSVEGWIGKYGLPG
ncbi:acetyltransferase [Bacillus sp. FJAT-27264]|uniref:N-acetyltransferase n=1 Tax=Paenibacillus sp. (strain DSM 101736 / FJAT-27264) TaxID=1850362 RepID=UPI000807F363|nr:N-acetyltransferase [Bacillus sp. FJAT-27264]OBZ19178.1 acetyltransferase [Bacillus sp. FJAT-27264]